MKFYFVHIVKVCFVLKNYYYAYIPPYMHKTLPALGNVKEQQQTEYYKKSLGELIFSWATKNVNILFHLTNWASAQKGKTPDIYIYIYIYIVVTERDDGKVTIYWDKTIKMDRKVEL